MQDTNYSTDPNFVNTDTTTIHFSNIPATTVIGTTKYFPSNYDSSPHVSKLSRNLSIANLAGAIAFLLLTGVSVLFLAIQGPTMIVLSTALGIILVILECCLNTCMIGVGSIGVTAGIFTFSNNRSMAVNARLKLAIAYAALLIIMAGVYFLFTLLNFLPAIIHGSGADRGYWDKNNAAIGVSVVVALASCLCLGLLVPIILIPLALAQATIIYMQRNLQIGTENVSTLPSSVPNVSIPLDNVTIPSNV